MIRRFRKYLQEKLILPNKGKRYGQVVILAGGAASGKTFAKKHFIRSEDYKVIDPDQVKYLMVALANKGSEAFKDVKGVDMTNPDDIQKVHNTMNDMRLGTKRRDVMYGDNPNRSELPNLMLDRTLAWGTEVTSITRKLVKAGYKPENIHVIWVLTDFQFALQVNRKRKRTLPDEVIMFTHKGAKTSLVNLIFGRTSALVNGEVYVIYGGPENTVYYVDEKGKPLDGKDGRPIVIKDFDYVRVKESGKKPDRTGDIIKKLMMKVSQLTP